MSDPRPNSRRRFDLDTRRKRRYELNYRKRLIDEEQAKALAEHHPKIYAITRALAEQRVAERRGALPGDESGDPQ